jgi:transposase
VFGAVVAVASVVPVSLLVSMVRRVATRTVDCCLEHARQTSNLPWPSPCRMVASFDTDGRKSIREIVHSRCAGMDVSKRDAKVCVRVAGKGRRKTVETVGTWSATTNAILALREHLINEQVSLVVMEATGDYWKPFYYLLEDVGFEVMLVNARHVKNLPGRKSDVSDAAWLAQLGAHGLLRGSFG